MNRFGWIRLVFALAVCFGAQLLPFANGKPDGTVSGETGARLDEYLTRLSRFGFSGAVLVAKEGRVLLHKGYGWANKQGGVPNTTQTVFDIASLTKQFTAAAILKLEAQGKLKTGDPISKHLPNVPPDKAGITIHHLLTHTSGFRPDFADGKQITRDQFVAGMLKMPLVAETGKRYIYANSGYCLLAAIVEIVSGQPYNQFVVEQLYKPAGMSRTGCYDDSERWPGVVIAHGYNESTDNGMPIARPSNWGVRGAYDALTTVGDLYKWVVALRNNKVLPEAEVKKLFYLQAATGDPGLDYGYGWLIGKTADGKKVISHAGSHFEGFNASCRMYVDDDVVVIATANKIFGRFEPLGTVEQNLGSIIFKGRLPNGLEALPDAAKIESALLSGYTGTYALSSGGKLNVDAEDDHLKISAVGQEAVDLLMAASAEERKRHADFNKRATAIFEGIARRDFEPLAAEFKQKPGFAEFKQAAEALWKKFEASHGAFKSVELLGTVPEVEAAMTYVRLNFERGSEQRRIRWEGGKLAYVLLGAPPFIPTWFVAQSKDSFSGYHVVIGRVVKITFTNGASLTVVSDKGKPLATAVKL